MKARARRCTSWTTSLPLELKATRSADGTAAWIRSATEISSSCWAPYVNGRSAARCAAATSAGWE